MWVSSGVYRSCHAQCQRGTGCKIAWLDTLKGVSMGQCGGFNVCHWHLDCHGLTKEDTKLRLERCGELLISRLGDLQCLPSYLYTCAGNCNDQFPHSPDMVPKGRLGLSLCAGPPVTGSTSDSGL